MKKNTCYFREIFNSIIIAIMINFHNLSFLPMSVMEYRYRLYYYRTQIIEFVRSCRPKP